MANIRKVKVRNVASGRYVLILFGIVVCACGLGFWQYAAYRLSAELRLANMVEAAGGTVETIHQTNRFDKVITWLGFDEIRYVQTITLRSATIDNDLCRAISGARRVSVLRIGGSHIDADDLVRILRNRPLIELELGAVDISPAVWDAIIRMRDLRSLNIAGSTLSAPSLRRVSELSLAILDMSYTAADDTVLVALAARSGPSWLDLTQTQITSAGLCRFGASQPATTRLSIGRTMIDDESMACLDLFEHLIYLDVSDTAITDVGIQAMPPMARLTTIHLTGLTITDAGLPTLAARCPQLRLVDLRATKVTQTGIEGLQQSMSNVRVHSNFGDGSLWEGR